MKKTYKNPSMMVVNIKPVHILAGSIKDVVGGPQKGGDWTSGSANARGSRFSDSDWDEE